MIVIGSIYQNQCVVNKNIPIWLIVFGAVGVLKLLLRLFVNIIYKHRLITTIIFLFDYIKNIVSFSSLEKIVNQRL
jgi:hypothetical protein